MKPILAAALMAIPLPTLAEAQARMEGVYDGREIDGWTYSQQTAETSSLPTWLPTQRETLFATQNCNIGVASLSASRADYDAYFNSATPESIAQELRGAGSDVAQAYSTTVVELPGGYPAMRTIFTSRSGNSEFDHLTVLIGGESQLATITCSATSGEFLSGLRAFERFVDGLQLEMAPPR
ncbi:hypothetical protein [Maricaulis sp.]|uniref:hypothetical protein n=1 Tax=Maricaulis sp. TaxID=1486257 RepID=UPI00262BA5B1|nr:hypothetical protein [Maricaulis sp.]